MRKKADSVMAGGFNGPTRNPGFAVRPMFGNPAPPRMPTPQARPATPATPPVPSVPPQAAKPLAQPAGGGGPFAGLSRLFGGNPGAVGNTLAAAPDFTRGVADATGGFGVLALADLMQNGGENVAAFFPKRPA